MIRSPSTIASSGDASLPKMVDDEKDLGDTTLDSPCDLLRDMPFARSNSLN
jgi:hypothetical protein